MFIKRLSITFITITFFLQFSSPVSAGTEGVPVLLKGITFQNNLVNPLEKTSKAEFEDILTKSIGEDKPPIVVFVKDNFCVEHIRQNKKSLQPLDEKSLKLLPSVESAFTVFENLPSYNISVGNELPSQFLPEGHLMVVEVSDFEGITDMYNGVKDSNKHLVIAITGHTCSFASPERIKRAVADQEVVKKDDTVFIVAAKQFLMYADKNPTIQFNGSEPMTLGKPTSVIANVSGNMFEYNIEFETDGKLNLKITFVDDAGYYILRKIEYSDDKNDMRVLKSNFDISFPTKYSFHCSEIISFRDVKKGPTINFLNLQMQLSSQQVVDFGSAYDCIGFTTIPIWSGLFVTAILALITIWALTMVLDIHTNDRFDDPKGKTVTVTASE